MRIFISQTIDGFVAGENDSLAHLAPFEGNDYGYDALLKSVSAVAVGRRTFDVIYPRYGWTYPERLSGVVLTNRPLPQDAPANVTAANDIHAVAQKHPDAFVDGGPRTIAQFLAAGYIRRADIFTLPVLLGRGVRLFDGAAAPQSRWELVATRRFPCGAVGCAYSISPL